MRNPIMFRRTHEEKVDRLCREMAAKFAHAHERHKKQIAKERKSINELLDKTMQIGFTHTGAGTAPVDTYRVVVDFVPEVYGGLGSGECMRMLGEMVGRRVECEIATSKFVEKASYVQ